VPQSGKIGADGWRDADRAARLRDRFLELLERYVPKLRIRGARATGCCPFHADTTPSFSATLELGGWQCFGCGAKGNVKDFAERVGEGWDPLTPASPYRDRAEYRWQRAHRAALAVTESAYEAWCRAKFFALKDQHRAVSDDLEICIIAYHQLHRRPELYTEADRRWWIQRLGQTYDTLARLEHDLDILTYREHEAARLAWWLEETAHGPEGKRGAVAESPHLLGGGCGDAGAERHP
jgi:CHC2 zinc finger